MLMDFIHDHKQIHGMSGDILGRYVTDVKLNIRCSDAAQPAASAAALDTTISMGQGRSLLIRDFPPVQYKMYKFPNSCFVRALVGKLQLVRKQPWVMEKLTEEEKAA